MRTRLAATLRPLRHFDRLLVLLNQQDARGLRDQNQVAAALLGVLAERSPDDTRRLQRVAVTRLRRRVWTRVGNLNVAREFLTYTRKRGLDASISFTGWREVWSVLQQECPSVRGRIVRCAWCGRLFCWYHRRDRHCSPLCRLAAGLLAGKEDVLARILEGEFKRIAQFEAKRRKRYGTLDERLISYAGDQFALLLGPVLARCGPFAFPQDVTDPEAFLEVWTFLFGSFPELAERIARCVVCRTLYWRYHEDQQMCSRRCQLRHYRASRAAPRRRHSR